MDPLPIVQAMTAPAVFFSGGALLLLSLNARLLAIFNRVRALHEQEQTEAGRRLLAALGRRARWTRNAIIAALVGVAAALASCSQMALMAIWHPAGRSGLITLAVGLVALVIAVGCYLVEVLSAVPSLGVNRHSYPSNSVGRRGRRGVHGVREAGRG